MRDACPCTLQKPGALHSKQRVFPHAAAAWWGLGYNPKHCCGLVNWRRLCIVGMSHVHTLAAVCRELHDLHALLSTCVSTQILSDLIKHVDQAGVCWVLQLLAPALPHRCSWARSQSVSASMQCSPSAQRWRSDLLLQCSKVEHTPIARSQGRQGHSGQFGEVNSFVVNTAGT